MAQRARSPLGATLAWLAALALLILAPTASAQPPAPPEAPLNGHEAPVEHALAGVLRVADEGTAFADAIATRVLLCATHPDECGS